MYKAPRMYDVLNFALVRIFMQIIDMDFDTWIISEWLFFSVI